MQKKPRRHFLREREAKKLVLDFSKRLKTDIEKLLGSKLRMEVNRTGAAEIYIFDGRPLIVRSGAELFPTFTFREIFPSISRIAVDMGAIPYVCKGADVMAPGVVKIKGEFEENDLVLVVDELHGKPLAIGVALFNSETMKELQLGRIVKNVHHVGDKLYEYLKNFRST